MPTIPTAPSRNRETGCYRDGMKNDRVPNPTSQKKSTAADRKAASIEPAHAEPDKPASTKLPRTKTRAAERK